MITQRDINDWVESEEYYSGVDPETCDHSPQGRCNMTVSEMVQEFAKVTGQTPTPSLYVKLIGEELDEWTKEGMRKSEGDLKELADLVYVIYGYANAMGYDLDTAVRRIHQNNIGRCVQPDGTVTRRNDGKIQKRKDYPEVNLEDLV